MEELEQAVKSKLDEYIKSLKMNDPDTSTDRLVFLLKRGRLCGAKPCATATLLLLRRVVAKSRYKDVDAMIESVQNTGRILVQAYPSELSIGNIVRRVLNLIRRETEEDRAETGIHPTSHFTDSNTRNHRNDEKSQPELRGHSQAPSDHDSSELDEEADQLCGLPKLARPQTLSSLGSYVSFTAVPFSMLSLLSTSDYIKANNSGKNGNGSPIGQSGTSSPMQASGITMDTLKSEVLDGIDEMADELEQVDDQIAGYADTLVHPRDYILVHDPNAALQRFLLKTSKERTFTLLITSAHRHKSRSENFKSTRLAQFSKRIQAAGVKVVHVSNVGLASYMPKVDKVIFTVHGVSADGHVAVDTGVVAIARSADAHRIPVVALMGIYQLSPDNISEDSELAELANPDTVSWQSQVGRKNMVQLVGQMTELMPTDLVDTYVSNIGIHSENQLSSLIEEHYDPQDIDFHLL